MCSLQKLQIDGRPGPERKITRLKIIIERLQHNRKNNTSVAPRAQAEGCRVDFAKEQCQKPNKDQIKARHCRMRRRRRQRQPL